MISLIGSGDITRELSDSHYGRKIRSYFDAYGLGHDFCRFYRGSGESSGIVLIFNSSAVFDGDFSDDDISAFLGFTCPENVEMPPSMSVKSTDYHGVPRVLFEFSCPEDRAAEEFDENAPLDAHYRLIKSGFPETEYEMWLVDMSHRIRHNVSKIFMFMENASATMQFSYGDYAFFSNIVTSPEARGQGLARRMLYSICRKFSGDGKRCCLFALPHRTGFYREIGFREIDNDIIYYKNGE